MLLKIDCIECGEEIGILDVDKGVKVFAGDMKIKPGLALDTILEIPLCSCMQEDIDILTKELEKEKEEALSDLTQDMQNEMEIKDDVIADLEADIEQLEKEIRELS